MPYVRKGKTVYKKLPNGKLEKKGTASSIKAAKAYMRRLYMVERQK